MTTKAVYVLEVEWVWDNFNTEYATLTVEEPEEGFDFLGDPKRPLEDKKLIIKELRAIADNLNRSPMGEAKLVKLYRVYGCGYKWIHSIDTKDGGAVLFIPMTPICKFDENDNPLPIKENEDS